MLRFLRQRGCISICVLLADNTLKAERNGYIYVTKKIKLYFVCMCTIASIFFNIQLGFAEDNDITEFYNNQTYGILFDNGTYLNEDTILTEEESKKLVDDINNGSIRYKTPREESCYE